VLLSIDTADEFDEDLMPRHLSSTETCCFLATTIFSLTSLTPDEFDEDLMRRYLSFIKGALCCRLS